MDQIRHILAERPTAQPTERQVAFAKRLSGIRAKAQLERFVARMAGKTLTPHAGTGTNAKNGAGAGEGLTRADWSRAIDAMLSERRSLR
jgi:hypothetical protein